MTEFFSDGLRLLKIMHDERFSEIDFSGLWDLPTNQREPTKSIIRISEALYQRAESLKRIKVFWSASAKSAGRRSSLEYNKLFGMGNASLLP